MAEFRFPQHHQMQRTLRDPVGSRSPTGLARRVALGRKVTQVFFLPVLKQLAPPPHFSSFFLGGGKGKGGGGLRFSVVGGWRFGLEVEGTSTTKQGSGISAGGWDSRAGPLSGERVSLLRVLGLRKRETTVNHSKTTPFEGCPVSSQTQMSC